MPLDGVPEDEQDAVVASVQDLICEQIGFSDESACPMNVTVEASGTGRRLRGTLLPGDGLVAPEPFGFVRALQQSSGPSRIIKARC